MFAESPSNPRLALVDLDELGAVQRPVHGDRLDVRHADRPTATATWDRSRLHSATECLAGHNDATLGVIAGERELIDAIGMSTVLHGSSVPHSTPGTPSAVSAPSPSRQRHQAAVAQRVAEALSRATPASPPCTTPAWPVIPSTTLAVRELSCLPTVLAVDLAGGLDAARAMLEALRLARRATSLGGPETLVCHSASSTHVSLHARGPGRDRHHAGLDPRVDRPGGRRRHRRRPRAGHPDLTPASAVETRDRRHRQLIDQVVHRVVGVALHPAEPRPPRSTRRRTAPRAQRWRRAPSWRSSSRWPAHRLVPLVAEAVDDIGRSEPPRPAVGGQRPDRLEHRSDLHPLIRGRRSPPPLDRRAASATAHAQPPGPGFPEHAPSV